MATATAYHAVNMDAANTWYGDVTIANSTQIQIAYGGYVQNYYGSFTYNQYGLTGGTVSATDYYEYGTKLYEIHGGPYSALTVANYIDSGNISALTNYIFGGNDQFNGSPESDVMNGLGGNDRMVGGGGNDAIDGGSGVDTAVYSGNRTDHTIKQTAAGWMVSGGADGTDTLTNVEKLEFADTTIDLAQLERLSEYYVAYYGRPGAAPGMDYWLGALNGSMHGNESQLVWNFGNALQPEFAQLYDTGGDIGAFVASVFSNLFNRSPAQAGIDYWTNTFQQFKSQGLDDDAIRGKMVTWIMDGARDADGHLDRSTLDNKVLAASAFTAAIDTAEELAGYRNPDNTAALAFARSWLHEVSSDPVTLVSHTDPAAVNLAIVELVGLYATGLG